MDTTNCPKYQILGPLVVYLIHHLKDDETSSLFALDYPNW